MSNEILNYFKKYFSNYTGFVILFIICIIIGYCVFVISTIKPESMDDFKINTLQTLMLLLGNILIIGGTLWLNSLSEKEKRKSIHLQKIKEEVLTPWLRLHPLYWDDEQLTNYKSINESLFYDAKTHFPKIFEKREELKILYQKNKEKVYKIKNNFPSLNINEFLINNVFSERYVINENKLYVDNSVLVEGDKENIEKLLEFLNSEENTELKKIVIKISEKEIELNKEINDALVMERLPNECQYV
mgnify:CR=1 FL=1